MRLSHSGVDFGPYMFIQVTVRGTSRQSVASNPYPDSSQCTWFAEERMHDATGLYMPNLGNAKDWAGNAPSKGWTVGSTKETSAVLVMQPSTYWIWNGSSWYQTGISSFGHVGWVDGISCSGSCVHIRDRNWNLNGQDGSRWVWVGYGEPVSYIYSSH
jgi:surface antigen